VFENRVVRKIFGPKRDEMVRNERKLHSEELHNACFSPNLIRTSNSRRMRWTGCKTHMGRRGIDAGLGWESRKKKNH
jgi:hypothetical protein